MITIIYPFKDYTSADIAIKLQALASGENQKIYVVPKHFGRIEERVYKELDKTDVALLIVFDEKQLDQMTIDELQYLKSKKVPIFAFMPNYLTINDEQITSYKYKPFDKNDILKKLYDFISNLSKEKKSKDNDWIDVLIAIGAIAGGLLLLNSLFKD